MRKRINSSIRSKILCIFVLITIIIEIVSCVLLFVYTRNVIINNSIKQMQGTIEQFSSRINEKLAFVLEQMSSLELNDSFRSISRNEGERNYVNDLVSLSKVFNETRLSNNKLIDNIVFFRDDGKGFYEIYSKRLSDEDITTEKWYTDTLTANGFIVWSEPYSPSYFCNADKNVISISKAVYNNDKCCGVLVINLDVKYLQHEISDSGLGENSEVFIRDDKENVLISVNTHSNSEEAIREIDSGNFVRHYDNVILSKEIPTNHWEIVVRVPMVDLMSDNHFIIISIIVVLISCFFVFIFISIYIVKTIITPLKNIENTMNLAEGDGAFNEIEGSITDREDEIGSLARNYNLMVDEIKGLFARVTKENELRGKAELSALQQQINSHFLYNTLESISMKIMNGNKNESFDMIIKLANYFRLSLNDGKNITIVRREIEHIENYLEIEKYRHKDKINYSVDVEPIMLDMKIPKLLLQPLVENSIVHGLFDVDDKWKIEIKGRINDSNIIFKVKDNGRGFENDKIEEEIKFTYDKDEDKNFALRNIYIRAKMYYNDNVDMHLYNLPEGGAVVELILPRGEEVKDI